MLHSNQVSDHLTCVKTIRGKNEKDKIGMSEGRIEQPGGLAC